MSKLKEIVVVGKEKIGNEDCISYQPVALESYKATAGEKALSHSFLMDSFRKLIGRTLTIIDASIADKQQNKAIKDLIRALFNEEMSFSSEMAYDQGELQEMIEESPENIGEPVSVEEALGV